MKFILLLLFASCSVDTQKTSLQSEEGIPETIQFALSSGLLASLYAKEACSCLFVTKLREDQCRDRVNFGATKFAADFTVDWQTKKVVGFIKPLLQKKFRSDRFVAVFKDETSGCLLTERIAP